MTPALLLQLAIEPALMLLPSKMYGAGARAMLLATAIQETGLKHRRQVGGPALSWWQFDPGDQAALALVLRHPAASATALALLDQLGYWGETPESIRLATEHNDVLAAGLARLLLWTLPGPLPYKRQIEKGWEQYLAAWNPGRPRPETWQQSWNTAWETVLL